MHPAGCTVLQHLLNLLQITSFSTTGTELVERMFQLFMRGDAVAITRSDKIMVKMYLHLGLK